VFTFNHKQESSVVSKNFTAVESSN